VTRLLRAFGYVLGAVIVTAVVVGFIARFMDGPLGPFPGGPLHAGDLVTDEEIDWAQFTDVREVELQLVDPPRSRTTWILVYDGAAYIPCGLPKLTIFKKWPHEILKDGRVVVRIEGKRYERQAVRVENREEWDAVARISVAKYGHTEPRYPDDAWFFRLEPRPTAIASD
jgi:hypothetical protein